MILSVAMLLDWIGEKHDLANFNEAATSMMNAVDTVLKDKASRTPDLGGSNNTQAFGELVADAI